MMSKVAYPISPAIKGELDDMGLFHFLYISVSIVAWISFYAIGMDPEVAFGLASIGVYILTRGSARYGPMVVKM
ncbi:hypothetical protein EYZ11_006094 [Aspergillus tanneri]|uniref:Uncharacterized protein n=1 Tax=Aspergillus tanneri TaxID=1220188 RepID=A0A4S3JGC0_9EURO|nr:hypothetical protein EYZ11_006094 [Aspergillus tanneri]